MSPEGFNRVANAVHDGARTTCRRYGCTCRALINVIFTPAGAVESIRTDHTPDCAVQTERIHGVQVVGVFLRGDPCLN